MKHVELTDVLDAQWLQHNKVWLRVIDGTIPYKTFCVARHLVQQMEGEKKDKAKFLQTVMYDISRRTVYNWLAADFDPAKAYPSHYQKYVEGLPGTSRELFTIQVVTKSPVPEVVADLGTCIEAIESTSYKKPLQIRLTKPRPEKQKLEIPTVPTEFDIPQTTEEKVVKMLEEFATGMITITDACHAHGFTYLQFIELAAANAHIREVYNKAVYYAGMLQNSRLQTLVDNQLVKLVSTGQHVTEHTRYKKVVVKGQLEPKWIEAGKTRTVREITPTELISIKLLLTRNANMMQGEENSEFLNMTDDELLAYIMKKGELPTEG